MAVLLRQQAVSEVDVRRAGRRVEYPLWAAYNSGPAAVASGGNGAGWPARCAVERAAGGVGEADDVAAGDPERFLIGQLVRRSWLVWTNSLNAPAHLRSPDHLCLVADRALGDAPQPHDMEGHPSMASQPQGWWTIEFDGIELFSLATVAVTRYTYRGNRIPSPWPHTRLGNPITAAPTSTCFGNESSSSPNWTHHGMCA